MSGSPDSFGVTAVSTLRTGKISFSSSASVEAAAGVATGATAGFAATGATAGLAATGATAGLAATGAATGARRGQHHQFLHQKEVYLLMM